MEPIYPICEEKILPYKGKQVCAVLHDGTCFYGTVSDIRDGQLFLSDRAQGAGTISTNRKKAKNQLSKKKKASVSALGFPGYGGYGYGGFGGGGLALSLSLIALLFAVPAFGFPFFI